MLKLLFLASLVMLFGCVEEIPIEELEQEVFSGAEVVNTPTPGIPTIPKDTSEPRIITFQPSGTQPSTSVSLDLQITTDEPASCRYDTENKLFDSLANELIPNNSGLSHSRSVDVKIDTSYKFYVRCSDQLGNKDQTFKLISFYVDKGQDLTPPTINDVNPFGKRPFGTTELDLSLATNEPSNCRYSDKSDDTYDVMQVMTSASGILHSAKVDKLASGNSYKYYFYCKDKVAGNLSTKAETLFEIEKMSLDGKALYAANCMTCHGTVENSTKLERSAEVIQDAIDNNSRMKNLAYLKALSSAEVMAIADVLKPEVMTGTTASFSSSVSIIGEEKALAVISIKLSEQAKEQVSVDYYIQGGSAIKGQDYEFFDGRMIFLKGEFEKSFTVGLTNDQQMETSETIVFGLRNPIKLKINGIIEHTLTIVDDDQQNPVEIKANFQDFAKLLTEGKCLTCHDRPGYGDFSVLTDLNNPISSERAWYFAKSNDGTADYIVPGKPLESLIYTRWRKLEDNGSVTGNMPAAPHEDKILTLEERKILESYIENIKIDETQSTETSIPNFIATNIGTSSGSKSMMPNVIDLETTSDDLGSTKENFYFNYIKVYGNFEISSRIDVLENNHDYAKAGFAIRESLDAQAKRSTGNYLNKQDAIFIHNRKDTAGPTVYEKFEGMKSPLYLKMTRSGIKVTYSVKNNKYAPWSAVISYDLPMDQLTYIGLSLSSAVTTNKIKARFSEINFKGTLIGNTNLTDDEIKLALQNNTADFAKNYDYGEKIDITKIDPNQKFERFLAVTQTYCMSCHDGNDPVARDFSDLNSEQDWLNMKDLSGSSLAIVKGSAKDSYLYKFLKHNQLTGTPASMPKNSPGYKAEFTSYVADWINSFAIEDGSIAQNCESVDLLPEPSVMRRISKKEYNNAIEDLFGLVDDYSSLIPSNPGFMGYDRVGGTGLAATKSYYSKIHSTATNIVTDLFSGKGKLSDKFNCTENSSDSCHISYLKRIAQHAFRSSLTPEQNASLNNIFNKAKELGLGKIEGTKAGLEYILSHPAFHYVMFKDGANSSIRSMSNLELLSQLSFFLWSSIPDEQDIAAVISGSLNLQSTSQLENFLVQMLNDPRAKAFSKDFTGQWLELEKVDQFSSPAYPNIDNDMKHSMKEESERLFDYIFDNELPFTDLITADYTFVNQDLADHYKFSFNAGNGFAQYSYQPEDYRRGLLSHASLLSITSDGADSRPTVRGRFVIDRIMCGELFDLPGGGVEQVQTDPTTPFRETVLEHSKDASCAGCHQIMDPIGLGLENFDQAGVYRTNYAANKNNQPVDSKGALYMTEFNSVPELTSVIKKQNAFNKCLTEQLMIYGTGIKIDTKKKVGDKCEIENIYQDTLDGKMSLKELLKRIVLSDSFRKRDLR